MSPNNPLPDSKTVSEVRESYTFRVCLSSEGKLISRLPEYIPIVGTLLHLWVSLKSLQPFFTWWSQIVNSTAF